MSTMPRILTQMSGVKKTRRRGYTRLSPKHQVTIPADTVEQVGLIPGDELRVEIDRAGRIVMSRPQDVDRHLRALSQLEGRFTGVWEPGEIDRLRDEWR
jgi:bifunctional DNA-binding transcriptional regulator/antitoxin component of YhaV-PrlF toxin-antitoxin module